MEYIKIAWRNIWRNRRRSIITMSSIFFAAFLAIVMRSFQLGSYDAMINTMIEKFSGYIQIEHPDFPEEPSIDNLIEYSDKIINEIQSVDNVKGIAPRLTFFSQAYSDIQNKGVMLIGIDPEFEDDMTEFSEQIAQIKLTEEAIEHIKKEDIPDFLSEALDENKGKYYACEDILAFELGIKDENDINKYIPIIKKFASYESKNISKKDDGVLIGSSLANYLKLNVGDSIVMMGLGYHGSSAAAVFPIKGIIVIPNPLLDGRIVYGSLENVQSFFSAYEYSDNGGQIPLLTTYGINLHNKKYEDVEQTRDEIIEVLNNNEMLVRGWKEANKELNNQIKSDNESGKVMIALLYIVIAFGVFGTVLMMIAERKREMGVMIAIGMKKLKLAVIVTLELIYISFIGLLAGIVVSIPIVVLGHLHPVRLKGEAAEMMAQYGMEPIMPFAWFDMYYLNQVLVVAVIVLVVLIYPIIKISKMKVIDALRA
jgi:ABC-type lipoprotein release transport system permease subunit